MSERINLNDKCTKCGISLRRQIALALLIDTQGAKTLDPCLCPKGGDHDFAQEDVPAKAKLKKENSGEKGE